MPALKIPAHHGFTLIPPIPCGKSVPVRLKSGQSVSVEFVGFICRSGAALFGNRYAKILATGAAKVSGITSTERDWRYLISEREYVLGCLVCRPAGTGANFCVYAVLDDDGWPIIMPPRDPKLFAGKAVAG